MRQRDKGTEREKQPGEKEKQGSTNAIRKNIIVEHKGFHPRIDTGDRKKRG